MQCLFASEQYTVEESCLQDEASSIVRECEQPEPGGKYFVFRQRCCYNQDNIVDTVVHLGASGMHCECQSDYCNGDSSKEITGTTLKTVGPSLEMVDPSLQTVDTSLETVDPSLKTVGPALKAIDPSMRTVGKSVSLTISIFALASEIVCLRLALGMLSSFITIFAV